MTAGGFCFVSSSPNLHPKFPFSPPASRRRLQISLPRLCWSRSRKRRSSLSFDILHTHGPFPNNATACMNISPDGPLQNAKGITSLLSPLAGRRSITYALSFTLLLVAVFITFRIPLSAASTKSTDTQLNNSKRDIADTTTSTNTATTTTSSTKTAATDSESFAPVYHVDVVQSFPHDRYAFTQGLAFTDQDDGHLYESTGKYGQSSVRRVNLGSGEVVQKRGMVRSEFGEGLVVMEGRFLVQVLWKSGLVHVYDREKLDLITSFYLPGVTDAWGIATPSPSSPLLYVSDGTARVRVFRLSITVNSTVQASAHLVRELDVTDGDRPVGLLNELEFVDGRLWANVLMAKVIAVIDVTSAKVVTWLDCRPVLKSRDVPAGHKVDVLNGIAYDPGNSIVYITGKYWPRIYAIRGSKRLSEPSVFEIGNAFYLDAGQVDYIHKYIIA